MASSRSLRSRPKQTRLQFHPLASSSPVKDQYSNGVQDRLANVRVEGARNHRVSRQDDEQSLPTPQPTSPADENARVAPSSSPLTSPQTSPILPPRFADIDSEANSEDDVVMPPSSKRRRLSARLGNFSVDDSSDSPVSADFPVVRSSRSNLTREKTFSTPLRRSTRATQNTPTSLGMNLRGSSRDTTANTLTARNNLSNLASPETSDDELFIATAPSVRKKTMKTRSKPGDDFVVEDDEEISPFSDEDVRIKRSRGVRRKSDDFVVDNDDIEYITSDEDEVWPASASKLTRGLEKHKDKTQQSKQRAKREQEELAEDLLDLQDSEPEQMTEISRTRGGPVTTQRDKTREHFELLKRRRAGERATRIIESDEVDDETWRDNDGVDPNDIGDASKAIQVISDGSIISAGSEAQDERLYMDDDDGFVVEDQANTGRFGRPNTDIPLQFTSFASAKPRVLFPHIIEWMVKNKISPAFNRNDDVYNLSFSRVDDQVKAQAGSRLISSAWNATFKYAMLARPGIHVTSLPGLDEELIRTCDACNKSNHPARYDFVLSGKAYSKATLEPVDDSESDEEEEANGDGVSYDEQGHVLASTNVHFFLGRFCAANAEMGHKLTHWKHHLNEQVLSYLEEQGVLSAEAIVKREKLNKKKREKEAENIVDMMQETGMIDELWQAFQDDLEDARIGMEGHERKGGRSKNRIGSIRVQRDNGTVGEWVDGGKHKQIATQLESDSEGE